MEHVKEEPRAVDPTHGKPSPRWAFVQRFIIGPLHDVYLDRMRILEAPLFAVWFHRIFRRDNDRHLHDHPRSFVSIVLRGSYVEKVAGGGQRRVRWINIKRAEDPHAIIELSRSPVWTLVFCGPRRREWGFHTETGWVHWRTYTTEA